MPDYGDENNPLASKKFGSIRFRRSGASSKRRSELKATISGPHAFGGGGLPTSLGAAPLRTLNGTPPLHHPNSASALLNGSFPPQQTFAGGVRRNSDIPLRRHHSSLAWPSNHPEITLVHGSPHHPPHTTHKKPRKVDISKPLVVDSSLFSSVPGTSRGTSNPSTQTDRGSRWSETISSDTPKGNPDQVTSQELALSDQKALDHNLLGVPSDEFDPRTMMESSPALDLGLGTSAASFGSVKLRTRKFDKALRASRIALLPVPREKSKPDLVYTDDSDAFSSPPSTPSTPLWETTAALSISKTAPKPAVNLELADVHAQIQAMIDSANRSFSTVSGDHQTQDQVPANAQRNDIPPSLRPGNPMRRSLPPFVTTHRRSASSPPLGSETYHTSPPDSRGGLFCNPIPPVMSRKPATPASPPPTPTSPTSATSVDPMTPTTPTRKPSSECSDSPSVYSQLSPSSQTGNVTPTSSNASSPDHPYTKSKHERLLAAISEGISSPTKPGSTAPSILGSGNGRAGGAGLAGPPLNRRTPPVPMIVVTDPNDDDLVYSESIFSIVDMYAGSVESFEAGVRRRRSRTANSYQPRHAMDSPPLRNSVSFNSPRRSQVAWERPPTSHEPPKRRVSIFRPGLPSSFLSMSTLHEAAEGTGTARDRKSFYAAVGLKGLFRRSSSKVSLFGQAQAQANGTADITGSGGGIRPGSTSLTAPSPEGGDDTSKGGWGLFKWKR